MIEIATNIFKTLSESEKKEIKNAGKVFGDIKFFEYVQKGIGAEEVVKFIIKGFDLKNFIPDALLWDSLKVFLLLIFRVVNKKLNKPTEIQIWIKDINNPATIDIVFSLKNESKFVDSFILLRTKLADDIFSKNKENEEGKIFLVALDRENNNWLVKVL